MKDETKGYIIAAVMVLILGIVIYAVIDARQNINLDGVDEVTRQEIVDDVNSAYELYSKNRFNNLDLETQTEYVEKMFFSSCVEISDFCENPDNENKEGCIFCENRS